MVEKIRIYEYAKKVGKSSKEIINILVDANIQAGKHMSYLSEEEFIYLEGIFNKKEHHKEKNKKIVDKKNKKPKLNKKKKIKKDKRKKNSKEQPATIVSSVEDNINSNVILVKEVMTVAELAEKFEISSTDLIKKLFVELKIMANINQTLTFEQIELIAIA